MNTRTLALIAASLTPWHQRGLVLPSNRGSPYRGPHTCPKCGKQFNGPKALRQHTKDAHKEGGVA